MRICVFCSSSARSIARYGDAAEALGRELGRRGHELVYGGTDMGLMKSVADGARHTAAPVIGVIPRFMVDEGIAAPNLSRLWVVSTMNERKEAMFALSDAFVALPGGMGTLEELIDAVSHRQLDLLGKPIAVVNRGGFFDDLLKHLERSIDEGFIFESLDGLFHVAEDAAGALDWIERCQPARRGSAKDRLRAQGA